MGKHHFGAGRLSCYDEPLSVAGVGVSNASCSFVLGAVQGPIRQRLRLCCLHASEPIERRT